MAPFNPDVQKVQDPSYLGMSQAISQPEGDKTAGTLLKGFGETLGNAFKGADEAFKGFITDSIHKQYDPIVEGNIKGTELALDTGMLNGKSLSQDVTPSVPAGVEEGLDDLSTAQAGFESTASRVLRTKYRGDIYTIAKDLRNQFPGYRDFIDQKISEVVGRDPANKYFEQTLGLLNQQISSAGKEQKQAVGLAIQGVKEGFPEDKEAGLPGAAAVVKGAQEGKYDLSQVSAWYSYHSQKKYALDNKKKELETGELGEKVSQREHAIYMDGTLTAKAQSMFENLRLTLGGDKTTMTAKELLDIVNKAQAGNFNPTTAQALEWRQQFQALRSASEQQMRAWGNEKDKNGLTNIQKLGPDGQKIFNEKLAGYMSVYDTLGSSLTKENLPLAAAVAAKNQAHYDDFESRFLGDPNWQGTLGGWELIRKRAPEASRQWLIDGMGTDLPGKFNQRLNDVRDKLIIEDSESPKKQSFLGAIRTLQATPDAPYTADHYGKVVNVINTLSDKDWDDTTKKNTLFAAYGPRNNGFLNAFERDSVDSKGNPIKGKFGVFQQFTSQDKMDEVARLGKTDGRIVPMVVNWAQNEFSRVFKQEVLNLEDIQTNPAFKLTYTTNKEGKGQFDLQYTQPKMGPKPTAEQVGNYKYNTAGGEYAAYKNSVNNLNMALDGLGNVAKLGTQFSPSAWALGNLIQEGYVPRPGSVSEDLVKKLGLSLNAPGKPTEGRTDVKNDGVGDSVPHFTQETKTPTLGDWLRSPTGTPPKPAKRSNLDGDIIAIDRQNVPDGMTLQEFHRHVKQREGFSKPGGAVNAEGVSGTIPMLPLRIRPGATEDWPESKNVINRDIRTSQSLVNPALFDELHKDSLFAVRLKEKEDARNAYLDDTSDKGARTRWENALKDFNSEFPEYASLPPREKANILSKYAGIDDIAKAVEAAKREQKLYVEEMQKVPMPRARPK